MKLGCTIDKNCLLGGKLSSEIFHDTRRLVNTDKFFELENANTVNGELPLPYKRSFARIINIQKKKLLLKKSTQI